MLSRTLNQVAVGAGQGAGQDDAFQQIRYIYMDDNGEFYRPSLHGYIQ